MAASSKEDSLDATAAARPLRSMQTGQNSIATKNSLPQLGQVRWDSALIGLTALQWRPEPKARQRSQEVRNRPARILANYSPVPQATACSITLARQTTFRNKIPDAVVLRHSVSIRSFANLVGGGCSDAFNSFSSLQSAATLSSEEQTSP